MGKNYPGITPDFYLDIVRGELEGWSEINKFGGVDAVSTTAGIDVYSAGQVYPFPAAGITIEIASQDDTADTTEITIEGLDSDFEPITGVVNLSGKTPVAVTDSDGGALLFYRVTRAWNSGSTDLGGKVYGADTGTTWTSGVPTASDILLQIDTDAQQTEMAIYTIPAGKVGYLRKFHASLSARGSAALTNNITMRMALQVRENGGVFRTKHVESVFSNGASAMQELFGLPLVLPEKSDIRLRILQNSDANAGVDAGFAFILRDEDVV